MERCSPLWPTKLHSEMSQTEPSRRILSNMPLITQEPVKRQEWSHRSHCLCTGILPLGHSLSSCFNFKMNKLKKKITTYSFIGKKKHFSHFLTPCKETFNFVIGPSPWNDQLLTKIKYTIQKRYFLEYLVCLFSSLLTFYWFGELWKCKSHISGWAPNIHIPKNSSIIFNLS